MTKGPFFAGSVATLQYSLHVECFHNKMCPQKFMSNIRNKDISNEKKKTLFVREIKS